MWCFQNESALVSFQRYTSHKPRQTTTFLIWFKASNFFPALEEEPLFILLWNCCRKKKWSFAQHYGCDSLGNGKEQGQIRGPMAFPFPADAPGQHGERKEHAVHSGRKTTNYIWYFQNTKRKWGNWWSCLVPLGHVIIPVRPEEWDSTPRRLLSLLGLVLSWDSSASPQKSELFCTRWESGPILLSSVKNVPFLTSSVYFKGKENLARTTQFTCSSLVIQNPLPDMIWIRKPVIHPDLPLITPPLETYNSWAEQFMLNTLPETSSSENQHQSFQGSGSCGEWEEEENWLAQTEACCCCKGYPASPIFSLGFVKMHVISAFSIHSEYLAGFACYAIYFLMNGSSTWLAVRLSESK